MNSLLVNEFDRRDEEVVIQPPLGFVELIKQGDQGRIIEAVVSQPLADVSPVFLLYMGVVIFFVWS